MTNLHSSNSELGKYSLGNNVAAAAPQPYVSNHLNQNIAQIARESIGFKSHEIRQKNAYLKDKKQRNSGDNLQFFTNGGKPQKKGIQGVLVKNTNNSAYTRAEKLLSYPMIESASSTGGHQQNHPLGHPQPQTVVRDLFGYTKVVMMP